MTTRKTGTRRAPRGRTRRSSTRSPSGARFPAALLERIGARAALRVRAGAGSHRFLGIWAVVVDDRVFVRSWNDAPGGWNRAWRADPVGAIEVEGSTVAVRARPVRGERLQAAVSAAYLEKYWRPGSLKWARGMDDAARRKTTLELVPD